MTSPNVLRVLSQSNIEHLRWEMAKKVTYVVFEGRKPGVYTAWYSLPMQRLERSTHYLIRADSKEQTDEYSGAKHLSYTIAVGGRDAAGRAYAEYISSESSTIAVGDGQGAGSEK